jgi:hypothetical protein
MRARPKCSGARHPQIPQLLQQLPQQGLPSSQPQVQAGQQQASTLWIIAHLWVAAVILVVIILLSARSARERLSLLGCAFPGAIDSSGWTCWALSRAVRLSTLSSDPVWEHCDAT